jgi:hypothetical protein
LFGVDLMADGTALIARGGCVVYERVGHGNDCTE